LQFGRSDLESRKDARFSLTLAFDCQMCDGHAP
jgi:hypothetical protein